MSTSILKLYLPSISVLEICVLSDCKVRETLASASFLVLVILPVNLAFWAWDIVAIPINPMSINSLFTV